MGFEFCSPTVVFIVISAIGIISEIVNVIIDYNTNNFLALIGAIVGTVLWVMLLNYLCSIDWIGLAWFLVIFPLVLLALIMLFVIEVLHDISKNEPTVIYRNVFITSAPAPASTTRPPAVLTTPPVINPTQSPIATWWYNYWYNYY